MKVFDHKPVDVPLAQSYPISVPSHTTEWIAGVVILAAIIGLFFYGSGTWDTHHDVMTSPSHETAIPPPVHPAPPPDSTKP
jgi:hypothetical protein